MKGITATQKQNLTEALQKEIVNWLTQNKSRAKYLPWFSIRARSEGGK